MYNKFFLILILLCTNIYAKKVINLATTHWPPYTYENGKRKGMTHSLVKRAFEAQGYTVNITYFPWTRALDSLKTSKFDGLFPLYSTKSRRDLYTFTPSLYEADLYLWRLKSNAITAKNLRELKGKRIGVVKGYANTKEFDEANYLTKEAVISDKQNLLKLYAKRIDLAVMDELVAIDTIRNSKLPREEFEKITPPLARKKSI